MGDGPKPLSRQRSAWKPIDSPLDWGNGFVRNVHDGKLRAIVAIEDGRHHLSISHAGKTTRYPTWDEITHARAQLLPDDLWFAMYLPPTGNYVAHHPNTFHLWETQAGS